jgi:uncharacterized protein YggE
MKARCLLSCLAAALVAAVLPVGLGQVPPAPDSVVTGAGQATLKRPPEILRLKMEIQVKAKNPAEALAKLKDKRAAVRAQLVAMGAPGDAITFADPKIAAAENEQQQMQRMVRERMAMMGQTSEPAAKEDKPKPVLVSVALTAEWPLKVEGAEERLLFAHDLEDKVKAADLSGSKEAEKLSPEEEEQIEEMQPGRSYEYEQRPQPGQPVFIYVSKIPETERAKLLAEAFQKARAEAVRLAEAAGAQVGTLRSLSSGSAGSEAELYNRYGDRYAYMLMQQAAAGQEPATDEAIAAEPGPIAFRVSVSASFTLKGVGG